MNFTRKNSKKISDARSIRSLRKFGAKGAILLTAAGVFGGIGVGGETSVEINAAVATAQETSVPNAPTAISGKIGSLGVFKNGIVVVEERFEVPGPGRYSVPTPPAPLHGTFFVASDAPIATTSTKADTQIPVAEAESIDWTTDFRDRWIRVLLPGEKEPKTVRIVPMKKPNENDDAPIAPNFRETSASQGVLLEAENGETIWLGANGLSQLNVVSLVEGNPLETVVRQKPLLIFDVGAVPTAPDSTQANAANAAKSAEPAKKGASIRLFYLTRGATWAPQYRVELKDLQTLEIEQTAIFANDWRTIENVPTAFFSGFPQIPLQNVPSPMGANVGLEAFFSALTNPQSGVASYRRDNFAMQTQAAFHSNAAVGFSRFESGAAPGTVSSDSASFSDGADVFAQNVGLQTLEKNARKAFSIAKKAVPYRRVVCWNISDARDDAGRFLAGANANTTTDQPTGLYGRTTSGEVALDNANRFEEPWDALQFRNPFDFPITTGPATVLSGAKFLGQNALYWTNPNEETLLPLTKALSVRVRSVENERDFDEKQKSELEENVKPAPRFRYFAPKIEPDYWGRMIIVLGSQFRVAVVDATITLENNRDQETTVLASRQFSGVALPDSFEGFDETLKTATLGESAASYDARRFNPRNELRWTTTLKPNEKKTLKFSYQTLITY